MPPLPVTTDCDFENEARAMIGGWANYSHYKREIEEDAIIKTPQGELLARFIPGALSDEEMELATPVLQAIKTRVQNRGNASAAGSMMPRVRKDGKLSRTNTIPPEVNRLLGFSDQLGYLDAKKGSAKRGTHYCRRTGLTIKHPEYLVAILPAVIKSDRLFAEKLPDADLQHAMEVRDPTLLPFDQRLIVEMGIADKGFFFEFHLVTQRVARRASRIE